jgi:hypothetical protein
MGKQLRRTVSALLCATLLLLLASGCGKQTITEAEQPYDDKLPDLTEAVTYEPPAAPEPTLKIDQKNEPYEPYWNDNTFAYINTAGEEIIISDFEITSTSAPGVSVVHIAKPAAGGSRLDYEYKWGYIDAAYNVIVPFEYDYASGNFVEGMAIIGIGEGIMHPFRNTTSISKNNLYGYINTSGDIIIPPQYDYAENFQEGRAVVGYGYWFGIRQTIEFLGVKGFIDNTGIEVVPLIYGDARAFTGGRAAVSAAVADNDFLYPDGPWIYIDPYGNVLE